MMQIRSKIILVVAALLAAITIFCFYQHRRIQTLRDERDRSRRNVEVLSFDVERYRTADSLSGTRIRALELTMREYDKLRAEDAALIKSLKLRNRDLDAINKMQSETIIELQAVPRDTIIIRDSVPMPAVAVHCGDAWFDFDGILTQSGFTGTLANRDSLMIAETVKYKRFLGFLWKTRRVKDRQIDVVSKNPHNTILGMDYIVIEK